MKDLYVGCHHVLKGDPFFKASTPNEEHLACKNPMATKRAKQAQVQESAQTIKHKLKTYKKTAQ